MAGLLEESFDLQKAAYLVNLEIRLVFPGIHRVCLEIRLDLPETLLVSLGSHQVSPEIRLAPLEIRLVFQETHRVCLGNRLILQEHLVALPENLDDLHCHLEID
ncbi:MAG: hypothetical protein C0P75_006260 [Bacilli bacterium]|uniref:hypothetical protein n=1 Tax=unclassified Ureibacillus TaxID=2638520 RepID=UPI00315941D3